jgi:two-component system KDP operon response regulator KdpE
MTDPYAAFGGTTADPCRPDAGAFLGRTGDAAESIRARVTDQKALLLVVDDEAPMRRLLRPLLTREGFRLLEVDTGSEALLVARTRGPQLILLDLGLPDGDGLEVTRRIRTWSRVPIIVISARGGDRDKVAALDAGADDYLTKPFGVTELLARIRVAFRHAKSMASVESRVFEFGRLRFDAARREVFVDNELHHFTPIEYRLLELLVRNAGRVVTHQAILDHVWGPSHSDMTHYVVVRMAGLRKKVERDPHRPALLITEPGIGYRLRDGR